MSGIVYVALGVWDYEGADTEPIVVTLDRDEALRPDMRWRGTRAADRDPRIMGRWESEGGLAAEFTTYAQVVVEAWAIGLTTTVHTETEETTDAQA